MKSIKAEAEKRGMWPKLRLGEKTEHGVKSTGPHLVKIVAEPKDVMMMKGSRTVPAFKLLVQENGQYFKWLVPKENEHGEGHYLIERLQDVEVGEEIILEMKKRGPRNYIDIRRPGDEEEEEVPETEDEATFPEIE